ASGPAEQGEDMGEADEPVVPREVMRRLRGRFATGVTVVTFRTAEGLRGVTVSGFAVASLAPPVVVVGLEHGLESEALLAGGGPGGGGESDRQAGAFGVSVLAEDQELLAERFAGRTVLVDAAFTGVPYHTLVTGAPLLDGAVAWFDCRTQARIDAGDHTLF